MSVELMDCFRMISSKVKEAGADEVSFDELASVLKELLSSSVYVLSASGKVIGISSLEGMDFENEFLFEKGKIIDEELKERIINVLSTHDNVYLPTYGFSEKYKNCYGMIIPVIASGKRLGTLFMYRDGVPYDSDAIILSEYGATIIGICILQKETKENAHLVIRKKRVKDAIKSLSVMELSAVKNVVSCMKSDSEIMNLSMLSEREHITRSIIVVGLKKLTAAGIIESYSVGRKGTLISIKNEYPLKEELLKLV